MKPPQRAARTEDVRRWVAARDGVAHTLEARGAGYSAHDILAAVDAGVLRRVRRSWLVTRECSEERVLAASVSGRVTCLSAAKQLGLWTPSHRGLHVAVRPNASRFAAEGLRVHWGAGPVPVARTASVDPLVNVLFHIAGCVPRTDALAVWESALRAGMAEASLLERVAWRSPGAQTLAAVASKLSDSGLETHFVDGMRRVGIAVRQQVWIDGRPLDGLIGERLVVQIDGFAHHSDAAARRRDIAADARLALRGYTVLRFDYQQILFDWAHVEDTVLMAIAQGLHRSR